MTAVNCTIHFFVWDGSEKKRNIKFMIRVGQNRIHTPYMTVYSVISLPKIPYIHRIYIWFWPILFMMRASSVYAV